MPQALKVELRCGLIAWVERLSREDGGGMWDWIGHIVHQGGKMDFPHVWRFDGQWSDDDQEHRYDIVRGLVIKPAATAKGEEHA